MVLMLLSANATVLFKLIFILTFGVFVGKTQIWNKIGFQNGLQVLHLSN